MSFLTFLNIDFPSHLRNFLHLFDLSTFAFLPNMIKLALVHFNIKMKNPDAPPGFKREGKKSDFLINNGVLISVFLVTFSQYFFSKLVLKTVGRKIRTKKKKSKCDKYMLGLEKKVEWNGLLRFTSVGFLKMAVFGFVQALAMPFGYWANNISISIAMFSVVLCSGFPVLVGAVVNKGFGLGEKGKPKKAHATKYGGQYEGFNLKSKVSRSFAVF